jgi:hypothetical protein
MTKCSIFVDIDGVLADFEEGIRQRGFEIDKSINRSSHLLPGSGSELKRKIYEAVKGTTFYADLPLMPGAIQLYNFVKSIDPKPIILTAAPKFGATEDDYYVNPYWLGAAYHKRNWVETILLPRARHERKSLLGQTLATLAHDANDDRCRIEDERFICTTSARKYQFMHRRHAEHQILIDDRPDNCEAWTNAGGIAIQHSDVDETIEALQTYAWMVEAQDSAA